MDKFYVNMKIEGTIEVEVTEELIKKIHKSFNKRGMSKDEIVEEVYRRLTWELHPNTNIFSDIDDCYIDDAEEESYKDEIRRILYGE